MKQQPAIQEFETKLLQSVETNSFVKLTLSKTRQKSSDIQNIYVRNVLIKGKDLLSFTYRYKTKDIVKNYEINEAIQLIHNEIETNFMNCDLFTINEIISLKINNKEIANLQFQKQQNQQNISHEHNKVKNRLIDTKKAVYLQHLGVTSEENEVYPSMQDKYKQINKFVEIIDSLVKETVLESEVNVVDMGAGKGYLTFATYDHLKNTLGKSCKITGVEQRPDMVKLCNEIAMKTGFANLSFSEGSIQSFENEKIDMLIALHACDTATDDAIYKGIKANTKIIVCAPCCHKQIRKQMNCQSELKNITKHGILEERIAETITDGIRALILEAHGYKTKVFEFISSEHTGKNVMITATKQDFQPDKAQIYSEIQKIKQQFGIEFHYLEKLLLI